MNYTKLSTQDIFWIGQRLPKEVIKLLTGRPRLFVAGGFIRSCILNEPVSDIDVFAPSKEDAKMGVDLLKAWAVPKLRFVDTDNAITVLGLRYPIQFIHRWTFDNAEDAMKSFDFTIAMAAVWMGKRKAGPAGNTHDQLYGLCHPEYYQDLAAKRLVYTSPKRIEEVGGSMLRVLKFYQREYRIPLNDLAAVVARLCSAIDTSKVDIHDEQAVSTIITGLLREVDPVVDPDHLSHLPNLD